MINGSLRNIQDKVSVNENGETCSDSNNSILYLGFDAALTYHENIRNIQDKEKVNESDRETFSDSYNNILFLGFDAAVTDYENI